MPLRTLYRTSERIVAARVGNSIMEKSQGDDSWRRTTFHVSESLKGDPSESTLQVLHWTSSDTPEYPGNFKKGDTILLFLSYDNESNAYLVADMSYGAKKLSEDDLKLYIRRIEELAVIMQKEKPDEAEIVEWLVRCAEEPATRWEGAYELSASVSMARNAAEAAAAKEEPGAEEVEEEAEGETSESESIVETEATVEVEPAVEVEAEVESTEDSSTNASAGEVVATLTSFTPNMKLSLYGTDIEPGTIARLTQDQKTRLANALFRADKMSEGEMALVNIVKDWGDERLVPSLAAHLRALEKDPPYFSPDLMNVLADVLKDESLRKLAADYIENAPYADYLEGESGESGEGPESEEAAARASTEGKKKISAVQKRGEMLREFLAAVENRIQYDLAMQLSR
jgi:hypothetical protein